MISMILFLVVVLIIMVVIFRPLSCPHCHTHHILANGFSVAGEFICREAWCDWCGLPLGIEFGGYVATKNWWSCVAIPKEEYDEFKQEQLAHKEALRALHQEFHA